MRALAMRLRSTSRVPWNALKNTAKNTITNASATFDASPRPSETMNTAPSTMRGIELATLMYGPKTCDSNGTRPRAIPHTTPTTTPRPNPMSASFMVTHTCVHSGPSGVPCRTHSTSWAATFVGCPQKNGSSTFVAVSSCQPPRKATRTASRSPYTTRVRRWGRGDRAAGAAGASGTAVATDIGFSSGGGCRGAGVGELHLVAQRFPDLGVQLDEPGLEADLLHGSRP